MKHPALLVVLSALLATFLISCKKEAEEPEFKPVICFFPSNIPVRIINSAGADLLAPSKLPSGTIDIRWSDTGVFPDPVKMTPAVYTRQGQADQYFISFPIPPVDKSITVVFSLEKNAPDTLYMRTAGNSSKPYGFAEISFNGKRVDPKMLFGSTEYGLELVKDLANK
jgi:hypothetical protein